jgi:hypothetical protein
MPAAIAEQRYYRSPASLKFLLATVIGNVKEIWQISLSTLATVVNFWQIHGQFQ